MVTVNGLGTWDIKVNAKKRSDVVATWRLDFVILRKDVGNRGYYSQYLFYVHNSKRAPNKRLPSTVSRNQHPAASFPLYNYTVLSDPVSTKMLRLQKGHKSPE